MSKQTRELRATAKQIHARRGTSVANVNAPGSAIEELRSSLETRQAAEHLAPASVTQLPPPLAAEPEVVHEITIDKSNLPDDVRAGVEEYYKLKQAREELEEKAGKARALIQRHLAKR